MRATLKSIMTAVGLVLIAIGAGALVLAPNLEPLFRGRFEDSLREVFDAEVTIQRIGLSPLKQCVDFSGVTIMNPSGFKAIPAFESDQIRLEFDPRTVFARSPVIRNTEVVGAHIYYRYEVGDGINMERLTASVDDYLARERARGFVVQAVNAEGAEVHFSTNLIPKSRVGLHLVDLHVDNAGDSEPVSAPKAAGLILKSIVREVVTLRGLLNRPDDEPEAEPL